MTDDVDGCEQDLAGSCTRCDNEDNDYDDICRAIAWRDAVRPPRQQGRAPMSTIGEIAWDGAPAWMTDAQ